MIWIIDPRTARATSHMLLFIREPTDCSPWVLRFAPDSRSSTCRISLQNPGTAVPGFSGPFISCTLCRCCPGTPGTTSQGTPTAHGSPAILAHGVHATAAHSPARTSHSPSPIAPRCTIIRADLWMVSRSHSRPERARPRSTPSSVRCTITRSKSQSALSMTITSTCSPASQTSTHADGSVSRRRSVHAHSHRRDSRSQAAYGPHAHTAIPSVTATTRSKSLAISPTMPLAARPSIAAHPRSSTRIASPLQPARYRPRPENPGTESLGFFLRPTGPPDDSPGREPCGSRPGGTHACCHGWRSRFATGTRGNPVAQRLPLNAPSRRRRRSFPQHVARSNPFPLRLTAAELRRFVPRVW